MLSVSEGKLMWVDSPFPEAVLSVQLMDGRRLEGGDFRYQGNSAYCDMGVFSFRTSGDILGLTFHNNTEQPVFLRDVYLEFAAVLNAADWLEYSHSLLFLEQQVGVKRVGAATPYLTHNPDSHMVYILKERSGENTLFLGALPPCRGEFLHFRATHSSPDLAGKFGLRIRYEQKRLVEPGKQVEFSDVLCRVSEQNPLILLEEYADRFCRERVLPPKPTVVGWNSWDELHTDLSSGNAFFEISQLRRELPQVRYFVLDDGWQKGYGLWEPNRKFCDGLKDFCDRVRRTGGVAGVWTAPVCVANNFAAYPAKWTLFNPISKQYVLDITRPDVLDYLRDVYHSLREAGFDYFKVDFTNNVLPVDPAAFFDRTAGHAGMLTRLYRTIREAIGPDAYLLGCCVPYEPAFGYVDAVRTTADIQIFWSSIQFNMGTAAARWWMHGKLWNNDPDFLVVRGPQTAENFTRKGSRPYREGDYASGPCLSAVEATTLALAVYMTGGDMLLSDLYSRLNQNGRAILREVLQLPTLPSAAVPVDLFEAEGELPSFWYEKQSGKLAVFNWSDRKKTFQIEPNKFGMISHCFFSTGTLCGNELQLQPHAAVGLQMK